jgi:two-component system, NarL family, nitrate/nitrite response regulator NarL
MEKIRILLADNHQMMMDGVRIFLERDANFEVVGAVLDGEAAVQFLDKNPAWVHVAILDIGMPVLNGLEAAKIIAQRHPKTKIILLTTHSEPQFVKSALHLQIPGYVLKDKSTETLASAIYAVMKNNRYYPMEIDLVALLTEPDKTTPDAEAVLTKREMEIMCLMKTHPEFTAKEIGEQLFIATMTVEKHQQNAKRKLGFTRNQQLIIYATENSICEP